MPQNASGSWNLLAPTYRFATTTAMGVTLETTFGQAYNGANFASDFNKILTAIDRDLRPDATAPPSYSDTDLMIGNLLSYPDNPVPPPH